MLVVKNNYAIYKYVNDEIQYRCIFLNFRNSSWETTGRSRQSNGNVLSNSVNPSSSFTSAIVITDGHTDLKEKSRQTEAEAKTELEVHPHQSLDYQDSAKPKKSSSLGTSSKPASTTHHPPSFSRKIKVLGFILGCCCLVAIIVNFINLHSDYEELHEFYIGYMGRKMLIQERRLTSRSYLNLLRREHQLNIEVSCTNI